MSKMLALALMAMFPALSACGREAVEGSGTVKTETRHVTGFDRVALSCPGDVIVTQGEHESLTVRTDDNLLGYIKTEVEGGTLFISRTREGEKLALKPTESTRFTLTMKDITGFAVSGSGNIDSQAVLTDRMDVQISGSGDVSIGSLTAQRLDVAISGSGAVSVAGEAEDQSVNISGSGEHHAGDLRSRSVRIAIGGSGDATVSASDKLDVVVSGSGSVRYRGTPQVTQVISGSGRVISLSDV